MELTGLGFNIAEEQKTVLFAISIDFIDDAIL
jgi:hypothetical protein